MYFRRPTGLPKSVNWLSFAEGWFRILEPSIAACFEGLSPWAFSARNPLQTNPQHNLVQEPAHTLDTLNHPDRTWWYRGDRGWRVGLLGHGGAAKVPCQGHWDFSYSRK